MTNLAQAIDAVETIKPRFVIPHHHWEKDLNEFKALCEKKNPKAQVKIIQQRKIDLSSL